MDSRDCGEVLSTGSSDRLKVGRTKIVSHKWHPGPDWDILVKGGAIH